MMLRAVVVAFLTTSASATGKACVAADTAIHGMTESTYLPMFVGLISKSISDVFDSNPQFKAGFSDLGKCQWECFTKVSTESGRLLWTVINQVPDETTQMNYATQMITGAFKTCYPGLDHAGAVDVAQKVVAGMGDFQPGMEPFVLANPSQTSCPGKPEHQDLNQFSAIITQFGGSYDTILKTAKYDALRTFFKTGAYSCQDACLGKTTNAAITNLWQSGVYGAHPGMVVEAFTGAIKACYPSPPRSLIHDFVTDIVADVNLQVQQQFDATIPNLQSATPSGFMVGAFVGSALLVSAVLVVKRKSQQTKRDSIAVSGEDDLETELDSDIDQKAALVE